MVIDLGKPITQAEFGQLVGVSQQAVSGMMVAGVITKGGTGAQWLVEYCSHLREMAAGRGASGDIDLVTERALLTRSQREGQEIKNAVARGTYAPIELLADVLSSAAQAVVDRLEQLPAGLRRACPQLPQEAIDMVTAEVASARNEMVKKTESIVFDQLDPGDIQEEEPAEVDFG